MASIKVKFRPSTVADHEGTIYYQREFGIRNAMKQLNRQLEKVADSFGSIIDI